MYNVRSLPLHFRTSFLDQEWFTFETVGTLVVGWEGGPSRLVTRQDTSRPPPPAENQKDKVEKTTGIEIAAAAATGTVVFLLCMFI